MISVFITATKPLFIPNNVEFSTEWVEMSPFWLQDCWEGGGEMGNKGMNPKPIIGNKVLCNNYVDGFF